MILDYHRTSGKMADFAMMEPWSVIVSKPVLDPNVPKFTVEHIKSAASTVRDYIETNHKLPNYVQIGSNQVSMSQFLELLTSALLQINSGQNSTIPLRSFSAPTSPQDSIKAGNIYKTEYLKIANDVKNYMDSSGKSPDFAYQTSLGTYLGFQNLVYMYSIILDYHNSSVNVVDYVAMKPWLAISLNISSDLVPYIETTANCQVNDPIIQALAAQITSGSTSQYDKAVKIFNWVRDNIDYSFYYNTQRGAIRTYNDMKGNCVDTTHLLIALERAAGIPAKYMHGTCTFSSGSVYGHVWAQVWVNGQWYSADGTSTKNTFGVINNWNTDTAIMKGSYASLPF
jgi:transglutaminase-like putative cysteine protease